MLTLCGLTAPTAISGETGGVSHFLAFATLYPNVGMPFNLLAKWVAAILVWNYTLLAFYERDLVGLVCLWAGAGFAVGSCVSARGGCRCRDGSFARAAQVTGTPGSADRTSRAQFPPAGPMAEMDALLDKIAPSGMSSLSAKERAKFGQARANLMRRESGDR